MTPEPTFLTVSECADLLRTTPKAIYTLVERGALPGAVKLGRRVLVNRDRLLARLERDSRA